MGPSPALIHMESSVLVLGAHQPVGLAFSWLGGLTQSAPLQAHGAQTCRTVRVINQKMGEHLAYDASCCVVECVCAYLNLHHPTSCVMNQLLVLFVSENKKLKLNFNVICSTSVSPTGKSAPAREDELQPSKLPLQLWLSLWLWMQWGFLAERDAGNNMQQLRPVESESTYLPAWVPSFTVNIFLFG